MRCRRCGAENAAHMKNCGNCGFTLDISATDTDRVQGWPPEKVVEPEPRPLLKPLTEATETPPALRTQNTIYIITGTILLLISIIRIIISLSDEGKISIEEAVPGLLGALLLVTAVYGMRRGPKVTQFTWQAGDPLEPLAEARGMPTTFLAVVLLVVAFPMITTLIYDDVPLFIPLGITVLFCAAFLVGILRTKVFIQVDSIVVGIPTGLMMAKFPMEKLDSVNMRGRVLRLALAEKASPISPKTHRFLILGKPGPIAAAIQAIGTKRCANMNVENVDIDPELLKSFMATIQGKGDELRTDFKGRYVLDESEVAPARSGRPEIISGLLAGAGVMAIATAFVFVIIQEFILETYGAGATPLECCIVLELIFAAIIFAGAVMAFRRKRISLVRISAIVAIISIGGIVSIALGAMSLILLRKCADEFT